MNKTILISSVLALSISLIPISSVKSMSFCPTPPPGTNQNHTLPYYVQVNITSKETVKVGESIQFESDTINQIARGDYMISYSWDFGDGNNSSNPIASNVFTKRGLYTVKLRITATQRPGYHQTGSLIKYFGETTKTIRVE